MYEGVSKQTQEQSRHERTSEYIETEQMYCYIYLTLLILYTL
jgi:hypothetical protein